MASVVRWTWDKAQAGWTGFADRVSERAEAFIEMQQQAHDAAAGGGGAAGNGGARVNIDFPAFWSFIGSRYTIALLLCAALANRIIAIIASQSANTLPKFSQNKSTC